MGKIYDANGKVVKKIKKKDIEDRSAYSAYSIYDENRYKIADMTHSTYPYTIEYEYETTYSMTMFFPVWNIVPGYDVAVEQSQMQIKVPDRIGLRFLPRNIEVKPIISTESGGKNYKWSIYNIKAIKDEPMSPGYTDVLPDVLFAPNKFAVENYKGDMSTWEALGAFNYELNKGRDVLSSKMKATVKSLVENAETPKEKIKILYRYLQENTRYVSVQLGIGGWQTFDANYVEKNQYGDCKALSNYMKSMLSEAGVEAHVALIANGRSDQKKEFSSANFNHVILHVPSEDIWLECTSTDKPAGYIGRSNEDRYALVITPDGGELKRTPKSTAKDNMMASKIKMVLDAQGNANINVQQLTGGWQHDSYRGISNHLSREDQEKWLREELNLPTFKINQLEFIAKKDEPKAVLNFDIVVGKYGQVAGKRLFIRPNAINQYNNIPPTNKNRQLPIQRRSTFLDLDEVTIEIPAGYRVESMPKEKFVLKTEFGKYEMEIIQKENTLIYTRSLKMNSFSLPKERYNDYRKFAKQIAKKDKMKVVLVKEE